MKITELITALNEVLEIHGDLDVVTQTERFAGPFVDITLCDIGYCQKPNPSVSTIPQTVCHVE